MVNARCYWSPSDDPEVAFLPIAPERLARVKANPFGVRDNLLIDDPPVVAGELLRYREAGGTSVVDATPPGLGRDVRVLEWLAAETGVNIIAGCGYYIKETHPPGMESRSVDDLAAEMIHDITVGMDGTDLKAGVIGEIGMGTFPMDPVERKVVRAAAIAQQETGCAIVAHSAPGDESPFEVLGVLAEAGADLTRVVQSHLDDRFRTDIDKYRRVADMGANLGLDTFGRHLYYRARGRQLPTDDLRVSAIVSLIEAGLGGPHLSRPGHLLQARVGCLWRSWLRPFHPPDRPEAATQWRSSGRHRPDAAPQSRPDPLWRRELTDHL